MTPANLREAHAHALQHGRAAGMCDLSACRSAQEALDAVAAHPPEATGWVLAHGARPEAWDDPRWPSRDAFEHAVGGRPAVVWCFDYHALLASGAAMQAAGIDADTRIEGGRVETGPSGDPTGVVLEKAALRVWDAVPEPPERERAAMLERTERDLASHGFVEVHDLKAQPWLGRTLREMEDAGRLRMAWRLFPLMPDLPAMADSRAVWESDRVRLGGGKIFVDGTLNSRTAWMLEPYADAPPDRPHGTPMMSPAEIEDAVRACDGAGVPLAAHAIGDGAVRAVLDAIESVRPRTPGFRIEHAELIDERDVPRFAQLGVTCSVQPCHLLVDIEALRRGVPRRLDRVLPLRELIESGLEPGRTLIFGSDTPIVRPDPGDSIRAAVHRRREGMPGTDAIGLTQALTEDEAWACFASSCG